MGDTLTTAASLITTKFQPGFIDEVSRYSDLLGLTDKMGNPVFVRAPGLAPKTINWAIHTSGSSPETYVENQPESASGYQGWGSATLSHIWVRVFTEYSGHFEAANAAGDMLIDALGESEMLIEQDVGSYLNLAFTNASNSGLQVAIDETTDYAGIARSASPSYWSSLETSVGTTLALSQLEDAAETVRGYTHQGQLGLLVAEENQLTNYYRLPGVVGASNNSVRINLQANGTPLDLGFDTQQLSFQGAPFKRIQGMTNTVICGLDVRAGNFFFHQHVPYTVVYQGRSSDADKFLHKIACCIQVKRPKRHFKLTGVTA